MGVDHEGQVIDGKLALATCKCRLTLVFDVLIILQSLFIVNFFQQTSP